MQACPQCSRLASAEELREAAWYPFWHSGDACAACVQRKLLTTLLERGEAAFHQGVQAAWPLDSETVFGALPTPLRLHAHPRFSGRGVTIAILDSGFYPHDDLIQPRNRIKAWLDATRGHLEVLRFAPEELPRWPQWDEGHDWQWHGTMTSVVAAGNGYRSRGLYAGLASEAHVVLIRVRDSNGHISSETLVRALGWLRTNAAELGVRVVSMSVSGDFLPQPAGNPVDRAVEELAKAGIVVVAAAGNGGTRRLIPPATAPLAVTVGGLDDEKLFSRDEVSLWHSNYGEASNGMAKPELVAPSMWVAAPLLPSSRGAKEAEELFVRRLAGEASAHLEIASRKLITPHYQHSEGTSFAAPMVASAVACMLEANPGLTPVLAKEILCSTAQSVPGASAERQGAGALDAGRAVAQALVERHGRTPSVGPQIADGGVVFRLHDHIAEQVEVLGSWDSWTRKLSAMRVEHGVWECEYAAPPGEHQYKFLVDGSRWVDDPSNPAKAHDGNGGFNSVLKV